MGLQAPVLDTDVDVILDDLGDVAGELAAMRERKPAMWGGRSGCRRCCCSATSS